MEELFKDIATRIALAVELVAALFIAYGAIEAVVVLLIPRRIIEKRFIHKRREVFIRFGGWLILGLEFELAADIIRTAISPTWSAIGQLAAIAAIRTFLNYFLERDIKEFSKSDREGPVTSQPES